MAIIAAYHRSYGPVEPLQRSDFFGPVRHTCLVIAAQVARTRDPRILGNLKIIRFLAGKSFSSFLAPASIPTVSASTLLCSGEGIEGTQGLADVLRGRIVIIAD